jgi:hypothetical protein
MTNVAHPETSVRVSTSRHTAPKEVLDRRRYTVAVLVPARHAVAQIGCQPASPGPSRAALQEEAGKETSLHEASKGSPAATSSRPASSGLTGCHSGRSQIAGNLTPKFSPRFVLLPDTVELMLYRLEAGRFASRLKARLPDQQRPSTPHGSPAKRLLLARRLLIMPRSRLRGSFHSEVLPTYWKWSPEGEGF